MDDPLFDFGVLSGQRNKGNSDTTEALVLKQIEKNRGIWDYHRQLGEMKRKMGFAGYGCRRILGFWGQFKTEGEEEINNNNKKYIYIYIYKIV